MKKKLLIVGGGFGQLPAIETAKAGGIEVIVVDKNPNAKGMAIADYAYPIDIIDKDGVLRIAQKHNINGIMTMQSDLPVPTVGYVNDRLGLNGVSLEVARRCSNKIETRQHLKNGLCSQPKFEIIRTAEEGVAAIRKIGLPCVIKAPDSSGSRGVIKVDNIDKLDSAIIEAKKYTFNECLLVEEFIDGLEFGAQTFSINGKCELVLLHNDTMSPPPFMIPIGHSFPFIDITNELILIAENDIKNAVNALGIENGPANVDLIYDKKENKVKIIEIGARIGATCLPELVFYHSGINWVQEAINSAINAPVDLTPKFNKNVAAIIIESPADGCYLGYKASTKVDFSKTLEFEVTVSKGEEVNILRKGTDRIGKIIAEGATVSEAEKLVEFFKNEIEIIVEQ